MYKSHNKNKGNTVTILDKFYTCICLGDRAKVIQPLARDHHSLIISKCIFLLKGAMIFL